MEDANRGPNETEACVGLDRNRRESDISNGIDSPMAVRRLPISTVITGTCTDIESRRKPAAKEIILREAASREPQNRL
jgi:hypothetical protein